MSNDKITELKEWTALEDHKRDMESIHIKSLFEGDDNRFDNFNISLEGFVFDYSKQRVTDDTIAHLMALARARGVEEARDEMVGGAVINASEERSVLHMALRGSCDPALEIDGENVAQFVNRALEQIKTISDKIRTHPDITDVINIGIGGSDLGPDMAYRALEPFQNGPKMHFLSNVDGEPIERLLKTLNARHTLVIITSKTFTTLETLTNARSFKSWMRETLSDEVLTDHMVAVTGNPDNARNFGVKDDHILPLRNWIGGRFSLWSAVGLPLAVACGFDVFKEFLDGAHSADKHFMEAPLERNIPALMAMIGIWYRNFWDYPSHAILPYTQNLHYFPAYMQQLDMESNGKSVNIEGDTLDIATGPVMRSTLLCSFCIKVQASFLRISSSAHKRHMIAMNTIRSLSATLWHRAKLLWMAVMMKACESARLTNISPAIVQAQHSYSIVSMPNA
jgi:glucose-6-phosphate isomerase